MNNKLSLVLKGAAMGIAEVIPGVSGGTIAFITGIYEELIHTIKSFGPEAFLGFKENGISGFWKAINGKFLTYLLGGMAMGILVGIFGVTYLLDHYPEPLWGFFFGLIVASAIVIGKQIDAWDIKKVLAFLVGVLIAYGITVISPSDGSTNPIYIFVAGMIAISALMLPGVSGSFILLLMGMYTIIINTTKSFISNQDAGSFFLLAIFGSGCLVGLLGFSRILSWLFKSYKNLSLALLTGFLIGALNKVWPWRNVSEILNKETGERLKVLDLTNYSQIDQESIKVIQELNVVPSSYMMGDPFVIITILCTFAGFIGVLVLEKSTKA
jgi:putative membrane protein